MPEGENQNGTPPVPPVTGSSPSPPFAKRLSFTRLMYLIFLAFLLWVFGQWTGFFDQFRFDTYGNIIVDSPQIYTRERLVNDRFREQAWLEDRLDKIKNSAVVATSSIRSSGEFGSVDQTKSLQQQAPVVADAKNESGDMLESPYLDEVTRFRVMQFNRRAVRQELIENELDDRHDLGANSLYLFKFGATVFPSQNSFSSAYISLKIFNNLGLAPMDRLIGPTDFKSFAECVYLYEFECGFLISKQVAKIPENVPEDERLRLLKLADLSDRWQKLYFEWLSGLEARRQRLISNAKTLLYSKTLTQSAWKNVGNQLTSQLGGLEAKAGSLGFGDSFFKNLKLSDDKLQFQCGKEILKIDGKSSLDSLGQQLSTQINGCLWANQRRITKFIFEKSPPLQSDNDLDTSFSFGKNIFALSLGRMFGCNVDIGQSSSAQLSNSAQLNNSIIHYWKLAPIENSDSNKELLPEVTVSFDLSLSTTLAECLLLPTLLDRSLPIDTKFVQQTQENDKSSTFNRSAAWSSYVSDQSKSLVSPITEAVSHYSVTLKCILKSDEDLQKQGIVQSPVSVETETTMKPLELAKAACVNTPLVAKDDSQAVGEAFKAVVDSIPTSRLTRLFSSKKNEVTLYYQFVVPSGMFNFVRRLSDEAYTFSYSVSPRSDYELVADIRSTNLHTPAARIESTSEAAKSSIVELFANLGLRMVSERESLDKKHLILGYGTEEPEKPSRKPLQCLSNDDKQKRAARFGWFILPTESSATGIFGKRKMEPRNESLGAVVSVPAWWKSIRIVGETGWLDSQQQPVCSKAQPIDLIIELPVRYELLDRLLFDASSNPPSIDKYQMVPQVLDICRSAQILIPGTNLWRSTVVTLGAQKANLIQVLPDMNGIIATFNSINAATYAASNGNALISVPLTVWTSEGHDVVYDNVQLTGPTLGNGCDKALLLPEKK